MQAWAERIALRHAAPAPRSVRLREPRGHEELAVTGVDTRAAVRLLDPLLDTVGAAELSASDRDSVLAALHRALWGDRIVASLGCPACGAPYDLSFTLSALQRQLSHSGESGNVTAPRELDDAHGAHWRLPAADDEEAAAHLGVTAGQAQLLALVTAEAEADAHAVGLRLEALAPLLDLELEAPCAECGEVQLARFDLQSFVLQRLLDEREILLGEVHTLAQGYRWSLQEILSLPRSLRRSLVQRLTAATTAFA